MPTRRTLRFGLWGGLLLGFAMPALGSGCRPGEGDRCFCYGECRGGLICSAAGATLRPGQCVTNVSDNIESGVCIEGGNASVGESGADPPPFWDLRYDLPKTDFAPPGNSATTDSATASGTDGSSSGTDSSTSGTSSSSTGTGTETDSATGSTTDGTGTTTTPTSG